MDTRDLSKVLSLKLIFLQIGKRLTLLNFILENLIPAHQVSVFFKRRWCLRITGLRVKRKVLSMKVSHSQTSPKLPFFLLSIQRNSPSALPSCEPSPIWFNLLSSFWNLMDSGPWYLSVALWGLMSSSSGQRGPELGRQEWWASIEQGIYNLKGGCNY